MVVGLTLLSDNERAGSSTGKPPAWKTTPLDVIDALLEVRVALIEIRPGIDDSDDGSTNVVGTGIAHLAHAGGMAKGTKITASARHSIACFM
jgi:hypothetical protein